MRANVSEDRLAVVQYLEKQLIGPARSDSETFKKNEKADKPHTRYLMGALFPQEADDDRDSTEDDFGTSDDSDIALAYKQRPSCCGLSLLMTGASLQVSIVAAIYQENSDAWERRSLASKASPLVVNISEETPDMVVFDGLAEVRSNWRRRGEKCLVTVTLINKQRASGNKLKIDQVLHQVWFSCAPIAGQIEAYPVSSSLSWDHEEEELALTYQSRKVYAVGHGCSVTWNDNSTKGVDLVETSFLPKFEVPNVTTEFPQNGKIDLNKQRVLSLAYLGDVSVEKQDVLAGLSTFVDHYAEWVGSQHEIFNSEEVYPEAAKRLEKRLDRAVARMRLGVSTLSENPTAFKCFQLANLAMLMQIVHSGSSRPSDNEIRSEDYVNLSQSESIRWRPFQLAFQLLSVESTFNENSNDRDLVDLVWFPTGGGKTEAYLALAAFELFRRRIVYGDAGGGTAIIKRYTLRLLTAQQFERCSALVCACEFIRKEKEDDLGAEPFTIGLWVGQSSTPNSYSDVRESSLGAFQKYKSLREDQRPNNPFQLGSCPWCKTSIIPEKRDFNEVNYGVRASESSFEFYCPNSDCCFNDKLPVQVVDEALYDTPPSFLIGTIDKFAQLTWLDKAGAFFGEDLAGKMPPSLIVQDELHLISGPLGTIAGLYEAAFDTVLSSRGAKPKYVAATATIRRAADQAKKLYARPVDVFPPLGARCTDSFFSREEKNYEGKGRLYVGIMGQYHNPVTAMVHTNGALAQAPMELPLSAEGLDSYWTNVIFHNSRRELGKTMSLCHDDIPSRSKVIASDQSKLRARYTPVEMSANIPSWQIPEVLGNLAQVKSGGNAIDALPCTNMFSVGVDVSRLGLIVMNGQPKTTAEYIQASSRVGRKAGRPGLVVAAYSPTKSRDRSHYETFRAYHQSLYRSVEPTSVTPSAMPALERALHAALVIVMRHSGGLNGNESAAKFNSSENKQRLQLAALQSRLESMEAGDSRAQDSMFAYLGQLIAAWDAEALSSRNGDISLVYSGTQPHVSLLKKFEPGERYQPDIPWLTLRSMRDVDTECSVFVTGEG